jgi:hypothetical protein
MTNINGHDIAFEEFDINVHALAPGYFDDRMRHFEEQYHKDFPNGWGEFFAAYSNGLTDKGNLDYDEWAFLCEHFLRNAFLWRPPGECLALQEKPEINSGFSFEGRNLCLIRFNTLPSWTEL